jgi:hypothetical protein
LLLDFRFRFGIVWSLFVGFVGVTPVFRRAPKCISYVRQDQFTHI